MSCLRILLTTTCSILLLTGGITQVYAQTEDTQVTPYSFKSPKILNLREDNVDPFNYRGAGVKAGSFLIWPNLTLEQEYNDNVLSTENDTESDFATIINPSLIIKKDYRRHEFIALLDSEVRRYWDLTDENVENYTAKFEGNLEVKRGIDIPINVSYKNGYLKRQDQRRASANDVTIEPLTLKTFEAETGIRYKPNRLSLEFLGNYRKADFGNGKLANGTVLKRDNRNVSIIKSVIRAAYDTLTGWTPFAEITFSKDDYTNETSGSTSRDNNLFRLLAGTSFNYKGLVYGFFGAGWDKRSYKDSRVADATGLVLESKISWEPRAKSKFTFDLSRETFEDNLIIAGLTETTSGLEYKHELKKDLFMKLMGSYRSEDFNNSARKDTTLETGLDIIYIVNPRLQIGADYNYVTRDSTISGLDMDNNVFMIRAKTTW